MKFAVLVVLGLVLGTLGGAAVGIGVGIIWSEIVHANTPDASGTLVFFTFMPIGAILGALGGGLLFGVIAARDTEIQIEREPAHPHEG
jgi:hypothetical protein